AGTVDQARRQLADLDGPAGRCDEVVGWRGGRVSYRALFLVRLGVVDLQMGSGHDRSPFSFLGRRTAGRLDTDVTERSRTLVQAQPHPTLEVEPGDEPGEGGVLRVALVERLETLASRLLEVRGGKLANDFSLPLDADACRRNLDPEGPPVPRLRRVPRGA